MKRWIAVVLILPTLAIAQQEQNQKNLALEEVIVTAQKKTESLQETPISITAFGAEQLERDGISNVFDLASKVPSLNIEPFPLNMGTLRMFIRGVGITDAQVTQDPPIAVYIDGAYVARSTGLAWDIADLQRIEVLRGPQGTLYGRNATGGAINLITQRPELESTWFRQKLTAGNRNHFAAKTTANLPVTENLAIKLAYLYAQVDGFVENTGPGADYGDRETDGLRFDLRWDIHEKLSIDYAYDRASMETVTYTYQPVRPPIPFFDPNALDATGSSLIGQNIQDQVNYTDKRLDKLTAVSPLQSTPTDIDGHAVTLTWLATQDFTVKYLYSTRNLSDDSYFDIAGGSGIPQFRLDNGAWTSRDGSLHTDVNLVELEQEQFSHEIQISGTAFNESLEYISGVYYFEEDATEIKMEPGHLLSGPISVEDTPLTTTYTYLVTLVGFDTSIHNEAAAIFARLTWTPPWFNEQLQFTLGGRHSEDTREARKLYIINAITETETVDKLTNTSTAGPPVTVPYLFFDEVGNDDFADDSFEFVIEYDVTDGVNTYAKWVEGYKSGGFNIRDPDAERFKAGFDEEKIQSIELGIKSELFNRRLRLNADIFKSDYTDIQINFLIGNSIADTRVVNAGEAEIQGLEADLLWLISEKILLSANYAYLDADMIQVTDPDTGEDLSDDFTFWSAPQHSYTLTLDSTIYSSDNFLFKFNLSYNYMDERNGASVTKSVPNTSLEDYGLFNARLSLEEFSLMGGELSLAAWVKNALDEEYVISAVDNIPSSSRAVLWGDARTYGFDLLYQF